MRKWLGFSPERPGVGIQLRDDGVFVALVRGSDRVVGLGHAAYEPGTVVAGAVRRPEIVVDVLWRIIGEIHRIEHARVTITVPPAADDDDTQCLETPVFSPREHGMARARHGVVEHASTVGRMLGTAAHSVETTSVSVARFLRNAGVDDDMQFARASEGRVQWTMCQLGGAIEVEAHRSDTASHGVRAGWDLSELAPLRWGGLDVPPPIMAEAPNPGHHAAAFGAAFGALGALPHADLAGSYARLTEPTVMATSWTAERVR